jgi:ABC-2 type transport system permease protein
LRAVAYACLWLFRRSTAGLLALLVGLALFEVIQPVAVASFGDLDRLQGILDLVPTPFLALLNVTPEFLEAAGLAGYLSLGFSHPVYHLLAGATVIWFAARSLAGEMERGSIQISLSRPMSRLQVYAARVIGILGVSLAVAIAGPIGMVVGIQIGSPSGQFDYAHLLSQAGASFLLAFAIGGATLLISATASRMGQAVGWSIALLVISYVVDYFAELWDALRPIEPFSVFDYYDPARALTRGSIPLENIAVLGIVGLVGTMAGAIVFARRDLP